MCTTLLTAKVVLQPFAVFADLWAHHQVSAVGELAEWLNRAALRVGGPAQFAPWAYIEAWAQQHVLRATRAETFISMVIRAAVLPTRGGASRASIAAALNLHGGAVPREDPTQCVYCLDTLRPVGGQQWPGGCGHFCHH